MTRGELWWADFGVPSGSEPGFRRPVLIVQADEFNKSALGTIVVVPFSTNLRLGEAPGNVTVEAAVSGLSKDSVLVCSQLSALDKGRLVAKVGKLEKPLLRDVEAGVLLVLGVKR
jgi:mRNA interferase MazF